MTSRWNSSRRSKTVWEIPRVSATLRASAMSCSCGSDAPALRRRSVTPNTSYPCWRSSSAAPALSTPPLMATHTFLMAMSRLLKCILLLLYPLIVKKKSPFSRTGAGKGT